MSFMHFQLWVALSGLLLQAFFWFRLLDIQIFYIFYLLTKMYKRNFVSIFAYGNMILIFIALNIIKNDGLNWKQVSDLKQWESTMVPLYGFDGIPFNVLELPDPDLTSSIENREVGGLGVHYVKVLTDSVEYEYVEKQNVLKMKKKLSS